MEKKEFKGFKVTFATQGPKEQNGCRSAACNSDNKDYNKIYFS